MILMHLDGYTVDEIQFEWRNDTPIQLKQPVEMPQFDITQMTTGTCQKSYITGTMMM